MSLKFITNNQLYSEVIEPVARARSFVWIGTADIKDLHVHKKNKVVSFLSVLNDLTQKNVEIRLLYAKEPGVNFKKSFDQYKLREKIEYQLCPRVHFKQIIIDGTFAYSGSANLTGAGLGIKSDNTRNFEAGLITTNPHLVDVIMRQFDEVWMGKFCKACKRRIFCKDPIL
ncbi:MAG: phospholipase D family protein [Candidatus Marinimicrobia bacterium]|nr:phospholipase D family protein [Candidatus Neomarinimicrobiota bacterium]